MCLRAVHHLAKCHGIKAYRCCDDKLWWFMLANKHFFFLLFFCSCRDCVCVLQRQRNVAYTSIRVRVLVQHRWMRIPALYLPSALFLLLSFLCKFSLRTNTKENSIRQQSPPPKQPSKNVCYIYLFPHATSYSVCWMHNVTFNICGAPVCPVSFPTLRWFNQQACTKKALSMLFFSSSIRASHGMFKCLSNARTVAWKNVHCHRICASYAARHLHSECITCTILFSEAKRNQFFCLLNIPTACCTWKFWQIVCLFTVCTSASISTSEQHIAQTHTFSEL